MKSIMGIVGRREGSVVLDGAETIRLPSNKIAYLGIALCPEEDCLPRGISQYADVTSEPRQQLPPPGDIDQPTNTRTFEHDRGARCVCH